MVRLQYGTMVRCRECIIWLNLPPGSMFQYIRSVRVEYVVRISSVTSLDIGHWKVFENISSADRETNRFAFTKTEIQFYKLRIVYPTTNR